MNATHMVSWTSFLFKRYMRKQFLKRFHGQQCEHLPPSCQKHETSFGVHVSCFVWFIFLGVDLIDLSGFSEKTVEQNILRTHKHWWKINDWWIPWRKNSDRSNHQTQNWDPNHTFSKLQHIQFKFSPFVPLFRKAETSKFTPHKVAKAPSRRLLKIYMELNHRSGENSWDVPFFSIHKKLHNTFPGLHCTNGDQISRISSKPINV